MKLLHGKHRENTSVLYHVNIARYLKESKKFSQEKFSLVNTFLFRIVGKCVAVERKAIE